jgi:hypothetical protein
MHFSFPAISGRLVTSSVPSSISHDFFHPFLSPALSPFSLPPQSQNDDGDLPSQLWLGPPKNGRWQIGAAGTAKNDEASPDNKAIIFAPSCCPFIALMLGNIGYSLKKGANPSKVRRKKEGICCCCCCRTGPQEKLATAAAATRNFDRISWAGVLDRAKTLSVGRSVGRFCLCVLRSPERTKRTKGVGMEEKGMGGRGKEIRKLQKDGSMEKKRRWNHFWGLNFLWACELKSKGMEFDEPEFESYSSDGRRKNEEKIYDKLKPGCWFEPETNNESPFIQQ